MWDIIGGSVIIATCVITLFVHHSRASARHYQKRSAQSFEDYVRTNQEAGLIDPN